MSAPKIVRAAVGVLIYLGFVVGGYIVLELLFSGFRLFVSRP